MKVMVVTFVSTWKVANMPIGLDKFQEELEIGWKNQEHH